MDYDEADQVAQADQLWHSNFRDNYNPTLTRGVGESLVTQRDGFPAVVPCVVTAGNGLQTVKTAL